MIRNKTLRELWNTAPRGEDTFDPGSIEHLPPAAQRYLRHALAPGARLSSCVRLGMTGTIKLDPGWCTFKAEQVIRWDRGFVWAATAWVKGLPVVGFDRLVDDAGAMRWKMLGLFPVMKAEGADITRAAAGRLHAEAIWVPAVLLDSEVEWNDQDENRTTAVIHAHGERSELTLDISSTGSLVRCSLPRWGDMSTGEFAYRPFGGIADQERTIAGVTIPVRHRVGWHFGTPAFEAEGEFFRCTLDAVEYR